MICEAGVDARDTNAAVWTNASDHLIQDFRGVGFESYCNFEGVEISLHEFTYTDKRLKSNGVYRLRIQEQHQVRRAQACQSQL